MFVSMKENIEIWRPVVGYEGLYEVSDQGRVRSLIRNIILKQCSLTKKYQGLKLTKNKKVNNYRVHRLVVCAFPEICGEWFEGCEVNHKNEKPWDNRAVNLEVCTHKYNINWGTANLRRKTKLRNRKDKSRPLAQLTLEEIFIKEYLSVREAARKTEIDQASISRCCRGEQFQAGGYIWRYV